MQKAVAFFSVFIYDIGSLYKEAMDLSDLTQSAPLLEGLLVGEPISEHHGVRCCPAIRENTDERYIVKTLSIPASQVQLDALLLTGAYSTPAEALEYFNTLAQEVLTEAQTLERLSKLEGFLPFTGSEVLKMKTGTGYKVNLLSPYRRSLERQMQLKPLTHLGAVNLGLDLCAALAICRRSGYLYLDLKPSNIYITQDQGCRIGDLGFLSLTTLKYASFPEKYRSVYTAPEIKDAMSPLNDTIDIYALGLVLYQVYNNGQLPFDGTAPETPLTPPMYADYEMAEIILKACDPDPSKRWPNPIQMGQALVAYMQRNSINDTPIIPPPAEEPSIAELQEEESFLSEEENEAAVAELLEDIQPEDSPQEDSAGELTQTVEEAPAEDAVQPPADADIPSVEFETPSEEIETPSAEDEVLPQEIEDETLPNGEVMDELPDIPVSVEVEEILAQADDLLTIELPEPPVAPDPIDIPFPAPIAIHEDPLTADILEDTTPEQEQEETQDTPQVMDIAGHEITVPDSDEEVDEETLAAEYQKGLSKYEYECDNDQDPEDPVELYRVKKQPSKTSRIILTTACCLLLLIALGIGCVLFYQLYYLQPIEFLSVDGGVDSLTTIIGSGIRDDLLEVVCTDTYGNTRTSEVHNGRAHFANLNPNTQYRVQVNISGFHKLSGTTTGSFTTHALTEILNFTAAAGPEDGSVILSFTVNGPESENWSVGYRTGLEPEQTLNFTGHTVTISDLNVGSEYQFRLMPSDELHLTGSWQLTYTPKMVVCAQDLAVKSYENGTLVAVWKITDDLKDQSWNVRCYNDSGYDQTITTQAGEAQFTDLDPAFGYTLEVTAVGMTQSTSISISANPITLTDVSVSESASGAILVEWTFSGQAPADGWIVDYTIDGGAPVTLSCTETNAQIPKYPGSRYEIDIRPVGDTTFFGRQLSHTAEKAAAFSGYGVTAKDMSFYMCRTPNKQNWDRFDVPAQDYVTEFKVGEKASFLVEVWEDYVSSGDEIRISYIIRDAEGRPLSAETQKSTWKEMWNKRFCELDIPQMPETAGKYTVEIYFNNGHITTEEFSVK